MLLALLFVGVISSEVGVTIVLNSFLLLFSSEVERSEFNLLSPLVTNCTVNRSFTGQEKTIGPVRDSFKNYLCLFCRKFYKGGEGVRPIYKS